MPFGRPNFWIGRSGKRKPARYVPSKPRRRPIRRRRIVRRYIIPSQQPIRQMVKLRYFDYFLIATGAATFGLNTFRATSIWDTDLTGVGGQCTGYTEWATMYNHYKVLGCKIRVRFLNLTSNQGILAGVRARLGETPAASGVAVQQQLTEMPNQCKYVVLDPSNATSGKAYGTVSMYRSSRRMFSRSHRFDKDTASDMGANPVVNWYYDVQFANLDGAQSTITVGCSVFLTYYVQLSDPAINYLD